MDARTRAGGDGDGRSLAFRFGFGLFGLGGWAGLDWAREGGREGGREAGGTAGASDRVTGDVGRRTFSGPATSYGREMFLDVTMDV